MQKEIIRFQTAILLIVLFGIAVYSNTLIVPFHLDDFHYILTNYPIVHSPLNLGLIWDFTHARFITAFSFALQYAFASENTWSYHLINLLIHLLASLAVFETTRMILRTPAMQDRLPSSQQNAFSLITALFFAVHPLQTQAVTYIVQRTATLATLFYITALLMYLKARLEQKRFYIFSLVFTGLAMLTKEISFTIPFMILLADFCFFPLSQKESLTKKFFRWLPFAVLLPVIPIFFSGKFILPFFHPETMTNILPKADTDMSRWDYLLTQFRVLRTYLRLLLLPIHQCVSHGYLPSVFPGDPDTWSALLLLGSIFLFAIALFKKEPLLAFGILWFFLTLSVESSIIPIRDVIFEHRLYLPMFGFTLFLSFALWAIIRSATRFLAIALLIILVFSFLTYSRNEFWRSPFALWGNDLKESSEKILPHVALGEAYAGEGIKNDRLALMHYHKAIALGLGDLAVLNNMTNCYSRLDTDTKKLFYQESASLAALLIKHLDSKTFLPDWAISLRKTGQTSSATQLLRNAIQRDPQNPFFYVLLGYIRRDAGQEKEAMRLFEKAIAAAEFPQS
ncbi:MAG TPA: hypothetical protein PLO78_06090 [Candidatus Omnitrophota bacterium]|nr:hypothetical protein [Candidatus Omnitrophota bacterium]